VKAPDRAELEHVVSSIGERTGRYLKREGLLVRDMDNNYLALEPAVGESDPLPGCLHRTAPGAGRLRRAGGEFKVSEYLNIRRM
jgi:hypothetical protein